MKLPDEAVSLHRSNLHPRMSLVGQKPKAHTEDMLSAVTPIADIRRLRCHPPALSGMRPELPHHCSVRQQGDLANQPGCWIESGYDGRFPCISER